MCGAGRCGRRLRDMDPSFDDILAANEQYQQTFKLAGLEGFAARELGVLTCIDSRIEPLEMLGLVPGDSKILRNAGARVTNDVIRTFAIATHLLHVRRIMLVVHTDCAMASSDAELRGRIAQVNPSADLGNLKTHTSANPHATIHADAKRLADSGLMAPGVVIGTFEYDVHTGALRVLEPEA